MHSPVSSFKPYPKYLLPISFTRNSQVQLQALIENSILFFVQFQQALRKFLWAAQSNDVNNNVLSLYILYDYVMFRSSTF